MYIIAGLYRHRKIRSPKGQTTRPTSSKLRESIFNICQTYIQDARFLDLFAGSGAMGLEALSRGAAMSTFIDHDREALKCINENIDQLGVRNQTEVWGGNAFHILERLLKKGQHFDIIYIDPPYFAKSEKDQQTISYASKTLQFLDTHDLLAKEGVLFLEAAYGEEKLPTDLQALSLRSSRRMGKAILQEYARK